MYTHTLQNMKINTSEYLSLYISDKRTHSLHEHDNFNKYMSIYAHTEINPRQSPALLLQKYAYIMLQYEYVCIFIIKILTVPPFEVDGQMI